MLLFVPLRQSLRDLHKAAVCMLDRCSIYLLIITVNVLIGTVILLLLKKLNKFQAIFIAIFISVFTGGVCSGHYICYMPFYGIFTTEKRMEKPTEKSYIWSI